MGVSVLFLQCFCMPLVCIIFALPGLDVPPAGQHLCFLVEVEIGRLCFTDVFNVLKITSFFCHFHPRNP